MSTDKTQDIGAVELDEAQLTQVTGGSVGASEPPDPVRIRAGEPPDPIRPVAGEPPEPVRVFKP